MPCIDISTLPRYREQENGNTIMAFEDQPGDFRVSYGLTPRGFSIRVITPYDRFEIPAKAGLTEKDVRRALRNALFARP